MAFCNRNCFVTTRLTFSIAPASGSFTYQTGDAAGIKIASRDLAGPTTTLALVSRAGTRYQWTPNLSQGLEKFAFKVGWHFISEQTHSYRGFMQRLLTTGALDRIRNDVQHFVLSVSPSC